MKRNLLFLAFLMIVFMRASADDYFDTSSMSAQDKNAPIGWGAAVKGSEDENQVTVTTLEELQDALTGTDKKTIIVSGTITFTGRVTIQDVQNKSIYGRPGAILQNPTHTATKENTGILTLKNCSNIIIRNLTFKGAGAYDIDGNDNLTLQNCSNIWVDHCDFQDGVDGNFDCNNGSDNICVSWCRFRYLIAPWSGGSGGSNDHRFSDLWGGGDGNAEKDEGHLNTTFVNCWWDEGCKQRMPRVRFGKIHILNCLYSSSVADYCVGGGYKSNVYIEKCAFTNAAQNYPWKNFATGTNKDDPSITYYNYNVTFTGNSGVADGAQRMYDTDPYYTPSYSYTSYASDQVESVVSNATNGAGATLKLPAATVYSWNAGNQTGGTAIAEYQDNPSESNLSGDITSSYMRLRGNNNFSTAYITITFNNALHAGDIIYVTAYRNKNETGKTSGFKAKFSNGSTTVASSTGLEFVNTNSNVSASSEYNSTPNTCTFTVPSDAEGSTTMTITRSHTSTNLYITKLEITSTAANNSSNSDSYTNTWQFGESNGAEEFALEHSAEYTYTVNEHSLNINTDAGKLNNASRNDQWAQCNNGTLFKVPTFVGAKLTWGRYSGGSETGFTIDEQLFNEYYIATAEGTTNMTATGIGYLSFIKVEPVTMYEITGTITGGDINGNNIIFTAAGNGQKYSATVAGNAFTLKVPADTYTPELGGGVAYVVSTPAAVTVSKAGSIGAITIEAATAQTVTGAIANAPAEAFTLTFTGASHTETVNCAANATSFSTTLAPDTYVMSSNVGTLSALSVESFQVVNDAVNHNIYFPEAAVPAATQQNITVDNTLSTATANNYKTVTDALAAAKAGSISSPVITLTSGQTYREQVVVDQANVTLKTSGTEKATITWYYGIGYTYYSLGANGLYDKDRANTRNSIKMIDPVRWGTAVLVKNTGNGFKAENIIFENSFNQYYTTEEVADGVRPNGQQAITYDRTLTSGQTDYKAADSRAVTERAAAIAFENDPTGCQLYNCTFRGSQDTFYSSGKLYVKKCNIIGNTDYIFGGGYVVFDDCDLTIGGYSDSQNTAYITAYKAGETLDASKKYVFRDCTVKATDRAYVSANLGRDWGGAAASVYFFNLKNEIGDKMSYTWTNMGGGVSAGTADLHIYDFDPAINSNYSTTGSSGANINGLVNDANALSLYTGVVTSLGFTPEHIYDIPLDENSYYNTLRINASNDGAGNITLTRSIAANKWSTICLPFAMTSAQLKSTFGDDVKVAELTGGSETTMNFTSLDLTNAATTTVANKPYAIKVSTAFTSATIDGVTVVEGTPGQDAINGWTFSGNYIKTNVPQYAYFFQNNFLKQASGTGVSLKPFRGYFTYNTPQAGREVNFEIDNGGTTGISLTPYPSPKGEGSEFFNLAGQRVTKSYKGIVIVNGKKFVIK